MSAVQEVRFAHCRRCGLVMVDSGQRRCRHCRSNDLIVAASFWLPTANDQKFGRSLRIAVGAPEFLGGGESTR